MESSWGKDEHGNQKSLIESTVSNFLFFTWPGQVQPGRAAGHYIQQNLSYAGLTEGEGSTNSFSQPSPTTSSSSELDVASNMFPAGLEDTKEWASGSSRSPEPVKEDWESETPFSNSSASSTCQPHNLIRRAASAAAGPNLRGADLFRSEFILYKSILYRFRHDFFKLN